MKEKKFTTKIILTSIIVLLIISNIITICYIYSLKLKEEKTAMNTSEISGTPKLEESKLEVIELYDNTTQSIDMSVSILQYEIQYNGKADKILVSTDNGIVDRYYSEKREEMENSHSYEETFEIQNGDVIRWNMEGCSSDAHVKIEIYQGNTIIETRYLVFHDISGNGMKYKYGGIR